MKKEETLEIGHYGFLDLGGIRWYNSVDHSYLSFRIYTNSSVLFCLN